MTAVSNVQQSPFSNDGSGQHTAIVSQQQPAASQYHTADTASGQRWGSEQHTPVSHDDVFSNKCSRDAPLLRL